MDWSGTTNWRVAGPGYAFPFDYFTSAYSIWGLVWHDVGQNLKDLALKRRRIRLEFEEVRSAHERTFAPHISLNLPHFKARKEEGRLQAAVSLLCRHLRPRPRPPTMDSTTRYLEAIPRPHAADLHYSLRPGRLKGQSRASPARPPSAPALVHGQLRPRRDEEYASHLHVSTVPSSSQSHLPSRLIRLFRSSPSKNAEAMECIQFQRAVGSVPHYPRRLRHLHFFLRCYWTSDWTFRRKVTRVQAANCYGRSSLHVSRHSCRCLRLIPRLLPLIPLILVFRSP